MSNEIIAQFLHKTEQVFSTIYKQKVSHGKPFILSPVVERDWDISGLVSIAGSSEGIICLRYKKIFVEKLYSLSKIDFQETSRDQSVHNDMIGEITNIIAGNTLSIIGGNNFYLSVPMTIEGRNHIISWPKNTEIIAIPLSLSIGDFELDICLKVNGEVLI